MPIYFYGIAFAIAILIGVITKKWKVAILIGYMVVLFSSMVLKRQTYMIMRTRIKPFSTYRHFPYLSGETIANIISFVPIGLLCGKKWKGILVGINFSVFIEIIQLLSRKGFFEIDDLFNNTIGTLIGVSIVQAIAYISKNRTTS